MKNLGDGKFQDEISNDVTIMVDTFNNEATVKIGNETEHYKYGHDITITDYEKLKKEVENKQKKTLSLKNERIDMVAFASKICGF